MIIDNMIQAIKLERNIKLIDIDREIEDVGKCEDLKEKLRMLNGNETWRQINEEFLNSFVEMLK